jgi:glutaredoxin/glutathione-dependent peroxiredoxin
MGTAYSAQEHAKEMAAKQMQQVAVGDLFPDVTLVRLMNDGKPESYNPQSVMKADTVVVFSVPGPFTPTCSMQHLGGFSRAAEQFKKQGIEIFCLAVSTPDVMQAWLHGIDNSGFIQPLADFGAELTFKLGLGMDASKRGLGFVPKRALLVLKRNESGKYSVKDIDIEKEASVCQLTSAESALKKLIH